MPPQVKKAKTAFLYYQGDQLSAIRSELNLSMGDAMTEVSFVVAVAWSVSDGIFLCCCFRI